MKNISLKIKLLMLIVSVATATLFVSGAIFVMNINTIYQENNLEHLEHDTRIFQEHIQGVKKSISNLSNEIIENEELLNSLNLISNYENPKEYVKDVFDYEKRYLLQSIVQWIQKNNHYSVSLFNSQGELIAIHRALTATKSDIGYISYKQDGTKYFQTLEDQELQTIPYVKNIEQTKNNTFDYVFINGWYFIKYTQGVYLDNENIGFVRVSFKIDSAVLQELNTQLKTKAILVVNDQNKAHLIVENEMGREDYLEYQKSYEALIKKVSLIDQAPSLQAIFMLNKEKYAEQLNSIYTQMIVEWILIFIATLFLSYYFIRKMIFQPLEDLQSGIKSIKKHKYVQVKNNKNDEIGKVIVEFNNISNELEQNITFLNNYKTLMDESSIVTKSDLKGNIIYANDNFLQISGYTKSEVIGKPHSIVRHPEMPKSLFQDMWETIQAKKTWHGIVKNRKKDGGYYWIDETIQPNLNSKGEIVEYMAIRHNITEVIDQRDKLDELLHTDQLTGLGNRLKLNLALKEHEKNALAVLNVDNFRQVNDFYGHHFGDKLIKELGSLISALIHHDDDYVLYHLQGDEFVLICKECDPMSFEEKIQNILRYVEHDNINVEKEQITVKFTAGISFESNETILQTADMALQIARKTNKDIVKYEEKNSLNQEYANNILWAKKIKEAIEDRRVVPFFQPIVNNETHNYDKYEALIRIIDKEDGKPVSPFFFLEIAKKTKYYNILTKVMIDRTFQIFEHRTEEVSLNVTIEDILNKELQGYIFELLQKYNIGHRVVFEIVESESIENFSEVVSFIQSVKAFGCKIAIDDFGTGYSNFEYLMQLQADYIKIDGSMIKQICTNENSKMVVETIVSFAKKMKMKTIAEFVEDEQILNEVKALGIEYSQGYHFSPPKQQLED